eukprot:TRINITY_DN3015_c0_g2_i1.p1 TRINITY_DN3015_c0_g2~~TRINITY_DN3015_c0_g2_i1.p1  ORF type:complete len:223 (+),score=16.54 TRINITY_DN3015_c0_g2_i1:742-1410(+)
MLSGILCLIFNLEQLANMISIGTLIAFTIVCGGAIVLRFESKYDSPSNSADDYTKNLSMSTVAYTLDAGPKHFARFEWYEPVAAIIGQVSAVVTLLVGHSCFSILLGVSIKLETPLWVSIICVIPMVIICILLTLLKPRNIPKTFSCPLVPVLPLLGVSSNIYLITQLPVDAVWRAAIWTAVGLLIYFGYGIRHSKLNNNKVLDESVPSMIDPRTTDYNSLD